MSKYRIESRWPSWAKWKPVTPKPHGEHNLFDEKGLYWTSYEAALCARLSFQDVNAGDFRVVEEIV